MDYYRFLALYRWPLTLVLLLMFCCQFQINNCIKCINLVQSHFKPDLFRTYRLNANKSYRSIFFNLTFDLFQIVIIRPPFVSDFLFALFGHLLARSCPLVLCCTRCRPKYLCSFPVWCLGHDVEFDCSWSLHFHQLNGYTILQMPFVYVLPEVRLMWKMVLITYVNRKGWGEPVHPCSPARAFVVRTNKTWGKRKIQTRIRFSDLI